MPRTSCNPRTAFRERLQEERKISRLKNDAICPECGETAEWQLCEQCEGIPFWSESGMSCSQCCGDGGHYLCPFGCAE